MIRARTLRHRCCAIPDPVCVKSLPGPDIAFGPTDYAHSVPVQSPAHPCMALLHPRIARDPPDKAPLDRDKARLTDIEQIKSSLKAAATVQQNRK